MDYETTNRYEITVRVSDDGTTPGPTAQHVDVELSIAVGAVNEGAPTFTSAPYTANVDEDASVGYDVFAGVSVNLPIGIYILQRNHTPVPFLIHFDVTFRTLVVNHDQDEPKTKSKMFMLWYVC